MITAALLVALGIGVGIFGTLVGAGGGFVLTPLLLLLYPTEAPATVSAVSLMVVFANAASGSTAYARQRRIDYRSGVVFALATLPGAVAGAVVVEYAPRRLFSVLTALILLSLALWLLVGERREDASRAGARGTPRTITDRQGHVYRYTVRTKLGFVLSLGVGFLSSFLGIGGGVIHVPLLVGVLGFPVHVATATSHFVLANMSLVGTITHFVAGNFSSSDVLGRALLISAGAMVGAQGGAWLSQHLPGHHIQRLLAVALAALATRLLVGAV